MKNTQKGGVGVVVIILIMLVLMGGGVYVYFGQNIKNDTNLIEKDSVKNSTSSVETEVETDTNYNSSFNSQVKANVVLSDAQFLAVIEDNGDGKILAKGDINGDGFEDAIVQEIRCGASCGVSLQIVFNENNSVARLFKPTTSANFEPAYRGSSAIKSEISRIDINDGVIYLTGTALDCQNSMCTDEDIKTTKTIAFIFNGKEVVQVNKQQSPEEVVMEYYLSYKDYKDGKTTVNNSMNLKYVTPKIVNNFRQLMADLDPDRGLGGDPFICTEEFFIPEGGIRVNNVQYNNQTAVVKLSGFAVGGVSLIYDNGWKINEIKCARDGEVSL